MSDEESGFEMSAEECRHFVRIINAYKCYKGYTLNKVNQNEKHYNNLPVRHRNMIPQFLDHLTITKRCILHNQKIIDLIVKDADQMFENKQNMLADIKLKRTAPLLDFDIDKVKSTLKQFMRDWSSDGTEERNACYKPVISEVLNIYSKHEDRLQIEILVPGAGLGRLAYELAKLGFTCEGNEFSLFMLFASNFVLNKCRDINGHTLYPWVHQTCNNMSFSDQVQPICFPDVNPAELPENSKFSMVAGDFLEIYKEKDAWDCIATVFFIDTAPNIMAYVESIYSILKPGGHWINFGPLLFHFADMEGESSIEISYEEVKNIILQFKFEIIKEQVNIPATYNQNSKSMLKYEYSCVFFVARKPFE